MPKQLLQRTANEVKRGDKPQARMPCCKKAKANQYACTAQRTEYPNMETIVETVEGTVTRSGNKYRGNLTVGGTQYSVEVYCKKKKIYMKIRGGSLNNSQPGWVACNQCWGWWNTFDNYGVKFTVALPS